MIAIQVKNKASVCTDAEVARMVAAGNKQLSRDFGPVYGTQAQAHFVAKDAALSTYDWQLIVVDDADTAGALGYHSTASNGAPIGYCFAKTTKKYGGSVEVTFSHELLEMVTDPEINLCALDETGHKLYGYEACDACESDDLAYDIDGVKVSDFVLPAFWLSSTPVHSPLSFTGAVKKPLQILPGGYLSFFDLKNPSKGWQQNSARTIEQGAPAGSRFPRRGIPAIDRKRSTVA